MSFTAGNQIRTLIIQTAVYSVPKTQDSLVTYIAH